MKFISWNVNGLRACIQKGFFETVQALDADVICLQETKMERGQAEIDLPDYEEYWNSAVKKGYSGTAVFTRRSVLSVQNGIGREEHDQEGRTITLDYGDFYLVNVYTPNSQRELARLSYRMEWEDAFRDYLLTLKAEKPVVVCGDFNVAHREIDLRHPKANQKNAGFTPQEREKLSALLDAGFIDTFRALYPDREDAYSWWSYRFNARRTNAGWRIDYFLVSDTLRDQIREAEIYADILGSDHCPVGLELEVSPSYAEDSPAQNS